MYDFKLKYLLGAEIRTNFLKQIIAYFEPKLWPFASWNRDWFRAEIVTYLENCGKKWDWNWASVPIYAISCDFVRKWSKFSKLCFGTIKSKVLDSILGSKTVTQLNSAILSLTQLDSAWLRFTQLDSACLSLTQLDSALLSRYVLSYRAYKIC